MFVLFVWGQDVAAITAGIQSKKSSRAALQSVTTIPPPPFFSDFFFFPSYIVCLYRKEP